MPTLGRFLSVDSIEGGTDNNYVYANDPVNQFDLDGRAIPIIVGFLLWNAARAAAPHVARAAVNYVVRPAVQHVAKKVAPNLTRKITVAARKIPSVYQDIKQKVAKKVMSVQWKLGNRLYNNKYVGVNSKLFGNARHGTRAGILNNYGYKKIGWSHIGNRNLGYAVFRYAKGDVHKNILWGPKLWK